jgi:hypothetical protein
MRTARESKVIRPSPAQLLASVACALMLAAAPAHPQDTLPAPPAADGAPPQPPASFAEQASPLLPEDHWAVRAAARVEALGLAPDYVPAQRGVPRHVVARALRDAAERAEGGAMAGLAAGWLARFGAEFPEYRGPRSPGFALLGGSAAAGVKKVESRLSPRFGVPGDRYPPPPQRLPDRRVMFGELQLGATIGKHLALSVQPNASSHAASVESWEAVAGWGKVQVSAGAEPVTYGWGRGGGFIFADDRPLPRFEVQTTAPVRLPWGLPGTVSGHLFVSRFDEPRHVDNPWLWGMRVGWRPHPRLQLGMSRGAMFGGAVAAVSADRLVRSFFGVLRQDFDNQILSADLRWRVPSESVIALTAYAEWAADDGAGAFDEQPAALVGVSIPALPIVPALSVGAEVAAMKACCGHGSWYFHSEFIGEWARKGEPLGHPLGGGGREGRVYADADLLHGSLSISADAYVRTRHGDRRNTPGNLFSPVRAGISRGTRGQVTWRLLPRAELRVRGERELGAHWYEHFFESQLSYFF